MRLPSLRVALPVPPVVPLALPIVETTRLERGKALWTTDYVVQCVFQVSPCLPRRPSIVGWSVAKHFGPLTTRKSSPVRLPSLPVALPVPPVVPLALPIVETTRLERGKALWTTDYEEE